MNYKKTIELLAPVSSPEVLDAAIGEGADAVYLGMRDFNARLRAKNFSYKQIAAAIDKLHSLDKKIYIAFNTLFEDREAKRVYNLLKFLNRLNPDGVIVQDLGVIELINNYFPDLKIHASTQLNISSYSGVNFLSKHGVNRVVLSRELTLDEIRDVRANTNVELEVFVHGALCISASGLCLFSSYLGGKSANRGMCAQPCRRIYNTELKSGYFFSPSDLMLLEHVPDFIDMGINSLKIEGRMRSLEYVGTVVRAYRNMIDNYSEDPDRALKESLLILKNDFAREKTKFFMLGRNNTDFLDSDSSKGTGIYIGKISSVTHEDSGKKGYIKTSFSIFKNDTIRIQSSDDLRRESFRLKDISVQKNGFLLDIPEDFEVGDIVYLINRKDNKKRYVSVLPRALDSYKANPGNSDLPARKGVSKNKKGKNLFPGGFYVKVNSLKDIFVTQSVKPAKLIVELELRDYSKLKSSISSTAYKPGDIIISLAPFFRNEHELSLKKVIEGLINDNFNNFIINNVGHINLFEKKSVNIIGGPYLYTFNKYSVDFLIKSGINCFINPLENNKKNLLSSTEAYNRNSWFITVFSYPRLFQIQTKLSGIYNFSKFNDKFGKIFNLNNFENSSVVVPDEPFSIIDKILYLKKHNFGRFIIDFSDIDLKKGFYKKVMNFVFKYEIFRGASRFNWKNGFFNV